MTDYITATGATGYGNINDDTIAGTATIDLGLLPSSPSNLSLVPSPGAASIALSTSGIPWGWLLIAAIVVVVLSDNDRRSR